ncbi:uncharacterized protein LOC134260013 [Saccostrea cucullata]|uniref:uncharacterized protein LOC134260013 n=1 Tax=Saccostrea cuccullata TaxID=36930 RepID=UPI002ED1D425
MQAVANPGILKGTGTVWGTFSRRRPNKYLRSYKPVTATPSCFPERTVETASKADKHPTATDGQHEFDQESSATVKAPENNGHDYLKILSDEKRHYLPSAHTFQRRVSERGTKGNSRWILERKVHIFADFTSKTQISVLFKEILKYTLKWYRKNNQLFNFCTGLDLQVFNAFFTYLQEKASSMQYFHDERTT